MKNIDESRFTITSTPHQRTSLPHNSTTIDASQDTGYLTGNSEISEVGQLTNKSTQSVENIFTIDDDLSNTPSNRTSFRGKHRFDIISGLLLYECSNLILRNLLSFIDLPTRLKMLQVCKSWYSLKYHIPYLFVYSTNVHPDSKENLHACPYCSGPAYHRPSEWPNRLHCQSSTCGVSVCFNCYREHSPSERCAKPSTPQSRQSTSFLEYQPQTESTKNRRKREKMALRRLL